MLHVEAAKTQEVGSLVDWENILEDVSRNPVPDLNTHLMLAVAYANLGMIPEATREFQVIEASNYDEFGKEVIRENNEQVKHSPDDIVSLNLLAFAHYAFGEHEKSLHCFESLTKLDPMNVWVHHYYAYSLSRVDKMDEAIDVLKAALAIDPSNEYTRLLLGLAFREKGWYLLSVLELARARKAISVLSGLAD
jgi:tetratricopeptide (TPR) repeat protein